MTVRNVQLSKIQAFTNQISCFEQKEETVVISSVDPSPTNIQSSRNNFFDFPDRDNSREASRYDNTRIEATSTRKTVRVVAPNQQNITQGLFGDRNADHKTRESFNQNSFRPECRRNSRPYAFMDTQNRHGNEANSASKNMQLKPEEAKIQFIGSLGISSTISGIRSEDAQLQHEDDHYLRNGKRVSKPEKRKSEEEVFRDPAYLFKRFKENFK